MGHPEGGFEVCLQRDWDWGFVEHQRLLQMLQALQTDQANLQIEASQRFHLQSSATSAMLLTSTVLSSSSLSHNHCQWAACQGLQSSFVPSCMNYERGVVMYGRVKGIPEAGVDCAAPKSPPDAGCVPPNRLPVPTMPPEAELDCPKAAADPNIPVGNND